MNLWQAEDIAGPHVETRWGMHAMMHGSMAVHTQIMQRVGVVDYQSTAWS